MYTQCLKYFTHCLAESLNCSLSSILGPLCNALVRANMKRSVFQSPVHAFICSHMRMTLVWRGARSRADDACPAQLYTCCFVLEGSHMTVALQKHSHRTVPGKLTQADRFPAPLTDAPQDRDSFVNTSVRLIENMPSVSFFT